MNHWKRALFNRGPRIGQVREGQQKGARFLAFVPGLCLILIGLVTVMAPRLVLAVLASTFVLIGVLFCFVAWKLLSLKRRFEQFADKLRTDGHVVDGIRFSTMWDNSTRSRKDKWEQPEDRDDDPKVRIIYH